MNDTLSAARRWFPALLAMAWVAGARADTLRLIVQPGYLPSTPVLVRVEVLNADGSKNRNIWDAEATLGVDGAGVTISTNRVPLKNGLGSALVTFGGGGNFNLTATLGDLRASRPLTDWSTAAVTTVSGTLPAGNVTWSGVVRVTNDVTVPAGGTLTLEPGTLVLLNGVASGTTAPDILVNGAIRSLGTEDQPVAITCASPMLRWGQIRHTAAQPSLYRHTGISRGGRATGEGHTGTGPVIRASGSEISFEHCSLTDFADANGLPGKVAQATDSRLVFDDCLLARARMGPEVASSEIICSNTWFLELRGPDDADGIYIHTQNAGQLALLSGCVLAGGDDDALDTLGSDVTLEHCIIRDWTNPSEDAKGISVFHGTTTVRRCVIVNCFVGISAKSSGPHARVNLLNSTVTGLTRGIAAAYKANATAGNILFLVTNCIVRAPEAVYTDFGPTNFALGYCNLSTSWPGTGNFTDDPLFVDAGTNHHLRLDSPCLDAGDPASPPDPDGTRADVGAFPYAQDGDSDGDGAPDGWERTSGTDPFLPDAEADPDHDGMTNLAEYRAGTSPTNAASHLRLTALPAADQSALTLAFHAVSNRAYVIEATPALESGWTNWLQVAPAATDRFLQFGATGDAAGRQFYRLRVWLP